WSDGTGSSAQHARLRLRNDIKTCCDRRQPWYRTTRWVCSPRPATTRRMVSPPLRNKGGLRPAPTPAAVPVVMMSPGASAMARDMGERVSLVDVGAAASDDERQLDLPVGLLRIFGNDDVVVGADDAARVLGKDDRLLRHLRAGLGGMVGVVEADAEELAHVAD